MKFDLGPVLGDLGLWCLKDLLDNAKQRKDPEMKKKIQIVFDIVEKYISDGFAYLGIEKKYYFLNKFGPKKCPTEQIKRDDIRLLYSWDHYAPVEWFDHHDK